MSPELQQRVLAEAKSWLRTPYHHQGRVKHVGVDCATLLVEVYRNVGAIPELDLGNYSMQWHLHREEEKYLGWLQQYGHEIETPEPADVVVFRFGRCFSHGGIVVSWPLIVHSYLGRGVEYCEADKGDFGHRLKRFYRVGAP